MNELEQTIIQRLTDVGGNVEAVARELSVSVSYVNRVKKNNNITFVVPQEVGPSTLMVPPSPVSAADVQSKDIVGRAAELLAPNLEGVRAVRDKVLTNLEERLDGDILSGKELNAILTTLLRYETRLKELSQPTVQTNYVDQRTQNVHLYKLVDKLSEADPSVLREIAGLSSAQLIEGEVIA